MRQQEQEKLARAYLKAGGKVMMLIAILVLWDWDSDNLKACSEAPEGFQKAFVGEFLERIVDIFNSYGKGNEHPEHWAEQIRQEIGIDIDSYIHNMV